MSATYPTAYIGIDPGAIGAVAALSEFGELITFQAPTISVDKTKGTRTEIDRAAMRDLAVLLTGMGYSQVVVEGVGGRKRDGSSAAFNFGVTTERMTSAFWYAGASIKIVYPGRWKAFYRLIGQPKSASVAKAKDLFPAQAKLFCPLRNVRTAADCEGIAEAALIAVYGATHHVD